MNDSELLAASARGDADAFATFYRRHLPRVVASVTWYSSAGRVMRSCTGAACAN